MLPDTLNSVLTTLLLVGPGLAFALTRGAVRGNRPTDGSVAERIFEALVVSGLLWLLALLTLGDRPIEALEATYATPGEEVRRNAAAFLGLCALAALVALVRHGELKVRRAFPFVEFGLQYRSDPTAWDRMAPRKAGFIRIKRASGEWYGGWVGSGSYVSTYPQERDIFVSHPYHLSKNGDFLERIQGATGIWLRVLDADVIEWIEEEKSDEQGR